MLLNTRISKGMDIKALRQNINCLCLHIKNNYDQKAKAKIGLKVFALEEKLSKGERMVFTSIHNNYLPEVANLVIEAKFPGFVDQHFRCINVISDFYNSFEKIKRTRLLIGTSVTIIAQYSDVFKDIYLLSILFRINGGLSSLYEFPCKFSSMIVICIATTIVGPLLLGSIYS